MNKHRYRIDFFQLSITPTAEMPAPLGGFEAIEAKTIPATAQISQYTREAWRVQRRRSPASVAGQFRKFRTDDLPEIGEVGSPGRELEIAENAGLIEKNFFVYYKDMSLLGWHSNSHGNSVGQFARFLSEVWGTKTSVAPVLQPEAAKRLLRGGIDLKRIAVTIARPRDPDMYPDNDFGRGTLGLLNEASGDNLHLMLSVDGRRLDAQPHLAASMKRALVEFANFGATTAKAIVCEDGIEHPIDLLADRVSSTQEIEHDGRYAPEQSMFQLIDAARQACEGPLREYFGTLENAVR